MAQNGKGDGVKTSWSLDYIAKDRSGIEIHEWHKAKVCEFEAKTGVSWSYWSARGKIIFRPHLDSLALGNDSLNPADVVAVYKSLGRSYAYFLNIAGWTNLSLSRVMTASLVLIRSGKVIPTCGRMGKLVAIKKA